MKILTILPSVFEAKSIFKYFKEKARLGKLISPSENLSILVSGIGCQASKERVERAVENIKPDVIILMGYCGACSNTLKNGDFVFESNNSYFADIFKRLNITRAKIACVDKTADETKKIQLWQMGYDAVDMESDFFVSVAISKKIDFIHIRCVSDSQKSAIPAEVMDCSMCRKSGNVNPMNMLSIGRLLKNPYILIKLIKFGIEIAPTQKVFSQKSVEIIKSFEK